MVMVVAMGFGAEVSGVAVGWWRGHGFWFGYVLCGGGSRWLQMLFGFLFLSWFWNIFFYYVYILF